MPEIRNYKPVTPSIRHRITIRAPFTAEQTSRKLLRGKRVRTNGRNNQGKITIRHRGGGAKRKLRLIDFKRRHSAFSLYTVVSIERTPNGSAWLALWTDPLGRKHYTIASHKLKIGDQFEGHLHGVLKSLGEGRKSIKLGGTYRLKDIPNGSNIFAIESKPGSGVKFARSAGVYGTLISHPLQKGAQAQPRGGEGTSKNPEGSRGSNGGDCLVKLPSGRFVHIHPDSLATVGIASCINHSSRVLGKAGVSRWLGRRPTVRGEAMNPVDHPHGGKTHGSGRAGKPILTKWGKLAKWSRS